MTEIDKEPIRIGVLTSLTGPTAEYGQNIKKGIELAVDEINAQDGIKGKKIGLFYEDSRCDGKEAVTGYQKLTQTDNTKIILGTVCSSETLVTAPLAEQDEVVLISILSTSPKITEAGEYIFRVYPSDTYEAKTASETIYNRLGKKTVSIVYVNNDYGTALKEEFSKDFTELGGTIVNAEQYMQGSNDLRTQLLKIKEQKPELIYMISYPKDGIIVLKQINELGIDALLFGSNGLKAKELIENTGNDSEGMMFVFPKTIESQESTSFDKRFEEKYHEQPGLGAEQAYDSIYLIKKAYDDDIQKLKNNLYKIQNYEGASGRITFDENGDLTNLEYEEIIIKNREFVKYE